MVDIISLIQTLGGIVGGLGLGMFTKSGRVKSQADAYQKMAEAYEYRIKTAEEATERSMKREDSLHAQIDSLNAQLDEKTIKMREYVADAMQSERDINDLYEKLVKAEKEIADLRVACEYLLEWRCEHHDCKDPRGRRPPNGKLFGQEFTLPASVATYRSKPQPTTSIKSN